MGSWGCGPLQNDDAADWIYEIGIYCAERVEAVLTAGHMEAEWHEVRAACWLLEKFGNSEGESGSPLFLVASPWPAELLLPQLRQGITWLTWLRDESSWHEDWDKPDELQLSLDTQISTLTRMLEREEAVAETEERRQRSR